MINRGVACLVQGITYILILGAKRKVCKIRDPSVPLVVLV
jgi:hypothetical protein